ncbi:MAG: DUF1080 domain-containing protein [Phycisphaerales bacterium]|nr:DUF1080 domain-containing protein [Phycisphaerales bacterium]
MITPLQWTRLAACVSLLAAPALAQQNTLTDAEQSTGWTLLFDGASVNGWTTSGNRDAWVVKDGEIQTTGNNGWWLRTEKMYRDFELSLDFNVPKNGNSGVGLRGSSVGDPAFTGMEVQIYDSYGQEPSLSACGAIYNAIQPDAETVNPPGEWNTYRIRLVGDTLDIWLNDKHIHKAAKLDDRGFFRAPDQPIPLNSRLTTGFIALQDHGNPVRFRNIKIHDLSPDPDPGDFRPLFNNNDLTGWSPKGGGTWTVEEGTLVGRDGPGHLYTDELFTDLEIRAFARVSERGNSGFYPRALPPPQDPDSWPLGYEAQIDNHDPNNWTGCVYNRLHPEGGYDKSLRTRDEAWFDYRVRVIGNRVQTWVNGVPMSDGEVDPFPQGHVALQTHNPGNRIEYRDIQVRTPNAQSGHARP